MSSARRIWFTHMIGKSAPGMICTAPTAAFSRAHEPTTSLTAALRQKGKFAARAILFSAAAATIQVAMRDARASAEATEMTSMRAATVSGSWGRRTSSELSTTSATGQPQRATSSAITWEPAASVPASTMAASKRREATSARSSPPTRTTEVPSSGTKACLRARARSGAAVGSTSRSTATSAVRWLSLARPALTTLATSPKETLLLRAIRLPCPMPRRG